MSLLFWLSILLCLIAGSAVDTSDICLVRAADHVTAGKPGIAIGILLVSCCATIVFFVNTVFGLHHRPLVWAYPTWLTIAGATMFAIGSMANGACAVGTIGRLARGDIGHLATFGGALVVTLLLPHGQLITQMSSSATTGGAATGGPTTGSAEMGSAAWLVVVLAFTAAAVSLGRRHLRGARLGSFIVLGGVGAVITDWQGNWTWIGLLQQVQIGVALRNEIFACIAAVVIGALVTAVLTGRFHLVRPDPKKMALEAVGGGLMVAGAILIPGANDALSVYGVPSGSPQAIVGYVVMFALLLAMARLRPIIVSLAAGTPKAAQRQ